MTIVVTRTAIEGDLRMELDRLENLLADLRHLAKGHLPAGRSLEAAPLLDSWARTTRPESCLSGRLLGRRVGQTSGILVMSPELGWVRTLSGFYRLGQPR